VILLIVGLHFRAFGAPLLTLGAAGIAYAVAIRCVGWTLGRFDIAFPQELEPLMVVLLLGIVTDYSIFFLEHARRRLREGNDARDAARHSASELISIIATAGLVVAVGSAALLVAGLETYRTLGPGLALTVLVGLAVSITLVPAGIAVFGRSLFWPSADTTAGEARATRRMGRFRRRLAYFMTHRAVALLIAVPILAGLVLAAMNIPALNLGFSLTSALPHGSEPRDAGVAAGQGFAPGIVSPTMLVLNAGGSTPLDVARVSELQAEIEGQPGVAGVVGPREIEQLGEVVGQAAAADDGSAIADDALAGETGSTASPGSIEAYQQDAMRTVLTEDGTSARLLVIFESDPLGGPAIDTLERLRGELPALLERAGLDGATASLAGDTALASDTIDQTMRDLRAISVVVIVSMLILLALFLRSVVAPFYLLAISILGYLATLGISAWVFANVFDTATTTFFVPFASAVLLVALGSDYNIFLAGRIWDEARREPLRDAISTAAPDASRAIAIAGITLAASFAVLAFVPIEPMKQLAFVMAFGILLDTFVIRALLVPAVIAAVGPFGAWPGRFRKGGGVERPALAEETDEVATVPEVEPADLPEPPKDYVRR
jgi:putative drug exporter of the RND superfamily